MTGEGRLVRDCMIEKINRVTPYTRPVRSKAERITRLLAKLMEEATEVILADSGTQLLEELGDLHQVMLDLAACYGLSGEDIAAASVTKYDERGGFNTVLAWRQPDD